MSDLDRMYKAKAGRALTRKVERRLEQLMCDFDDIADDHFMGYPEMLDVVKTHEPRFFDDYQDWITQ